MSMKKPVWKSPSEELRPGQLVLLSSTGWLTGRDDARRKVAFKLTPKSVLLAEPSRIRVVFPSHHSFHRSLCSVPSWF